MVKSGFSFVLLPFSSIINVKLSVMWS
jgi:hypothetical protein